MNHFKQKNGYGCGLFAIANALNKESIIKQERLDESIDGNHIGQLNKWLKEDGFELFIEPLYFSCTGKRLPKSICELRPHGEEVIGLPVLIDVQHTKNSQMHLVTADIMPNGQLLVIDSLKDEHELTTLMEYQKQFYRVFGLHHFRHYTEKGYFMRFRPSKQ